MKILLKRDLAFLFVFLPTSGFWFIFNLLIIYHCWNQANPTSLWDLFTSAVHHLYSSCTNRCGCIWMQSFAQLAVQNLYCKKFMVYKRTFEKVVFAMLRDAYAFIDIHFHRFFSWYCNCTFYIEIFVFYRQLYLTF